MVQTGEKPTSADDEAALKAVHELSSGQRVYDEDGDEIGRIRSFEQSGFFVTTRDGAEAMSIEHARSGHEFGEAHLMWRCMECGEMGAINDGFPDACPNCDAAREELMYWTED